MAQPQRVSESSLDFHIVSQTFSRSMPVPPSVILPEVRKGLAGILLVLVASLAAADPLFCPDGCTRTDRGASEHQGNPAQAAGTCLSCQAGVAPASEIVAATTPAIVSSERALPAHCRPVSAAPASIDHPPR